MLIDIGINDQDDVDSETIERELEIIGEALNNLKKLDDTVEITFYRQIIGLRNQIIHSYDNIDNETIWGILMKHLPILKIEIENLINTK